MNSARPIPNPKLDAVIADLHSALAPGEVELEKGAKGLRLPQVMIVGAPRGGTTLMLQWLAASGAFAYPTNFMARLSAAPAIAARLQQMYTNPEFGFGDDLLDVQQPEGGALADGAFESSLGKTRGALAPSEYWFFWRRFLKTQALGELGAERLEDVDVGGLQSALAALEDVFAKPLAMKGLMIQFDLAAFAQLLPRTFFLHVVRDPVYNGQSLLEARERYHGSRDEWYSVEPSNIDALRSLPPEEQVIGQVRATHRAIGVGLAQVDPSRWLSVRYEAFCDDPGAVWTKLAGKLAQHGLELPGAHPGPPRFEATNQDRLDAPTLERLRAAATK